MAVLIIVVNFKFEEQNFANHQLFSDNKRVEIQVNKSFF